MYVRVCVCAYMHGCVCGGMQVCSWSMLVGHGLHGKTEMSLLGNCYPDSLSFKLDMSRWSGEVCSLCAKCHHHGHQKSKMNVSKSGHFKKFMKVR